MKKELLIFSIILFVISSLSFAKNLNKDELLNYDYFNSIYLGVGTGISHTKSNVRNIIEDVESVTESHLNEINSDNAGNTQGILHVFTGFGKVLNEYFYLGGELFVKYVPTANNINIKRFNEKEDVNGPITIISALTEINLKNIYSYGGNIRFGYLVTNKVMFYGLIGLDSRFLKYRVRHTVSSDLGFFLQHNYDFKKNKSALTPGVGIEAIVYKNMSLRLQYSYSTYEKIKYYHDYSSNFSSYAEDTIDLSKGVFTVDVSFHLDK